MTREQRGSDPFGFARAEGGGCGRPGGGCGTDGVCAPPPEARDSEKETISRNGTYAPSNEEPATSKAASRPSPLTRIFIFVGLDELRMAIIFLIVHGYSVLLTFFWLEMLRLVFKISPRRHWSRKVVDSRPLQRFPSWETRIIQQKLEKLCTKMLPTGVPSRWPETVTTGTCP